MDNDQKRAFVAVILSGFILFGWQYFFAPKAAPITKTEQVKTANNSPAEVIPETKEEIKPIETASNTINFEILNETNTFNLSSDLKFLNTTSKNAVFSFTDIVGDGLPLEILFLDGNKYSNIIFNISKIDDKKYKLSSAKINGDVILQEDGRLKFILESDFAQKVKFIFKTEKKELGNNQKREYVYLADSREVVDIDDTEKFDTPVRWFGIDFNYHAFLVSFPEKKQSVLNFNNNTFETEMSFTKSFEFNLLFTKKEYNILKSMGDNLHLSVDFGIWSILAEPMLWILQKFYLYFPNYGLSIIFLTLMMRLVTYPLQHKSFKSMKKMQEIQPELTKLKEKFKDDPQRMQKESMELFKKVGANPLSGCLPLLLQMPVFFALYKVLYSSVELVGAPFYFWIQDLSLKDPYYVLPVLMAIAMFVQQKLTPTTVADPVQKKVMMFMPLVFGLIMKDLPSGLCLYIFVSTVLGLLQQQFVYKQSK